MCGFVAISMPAGRSVPRPALEQATKTIVHRGPDDDGYFVENSIGMGFRRLSIIDLSTDSHQPFEDADGRYVMVYNGEIYNYIELRRDLELLGHRFRTSGDTEVLLTAYKEWGKGCVNRLNGMWAFLIYDRHERSIFGSRDRFGVKPLYVAETGNTKIFASEIKAIFATGFLDRTTNWNTAAAYLLEGRISSAVNHNETFYEHVREIPAGHCFVVEHSGRVESWAYWHLPEEIRRGDTDPAEELRDLLRDSVRLRMRSDVPVGVCLSGGIDSTSIICLMSEELGASRAQPLNAFSYIDENFDETHEIQATIAQTRATLHQLSGNVDTFLSRLEEVLRLHDEPFHSLNVLISYELYRMAAASGVKVVLNGQGADETWAGYPSYFYNFWYTLASSGRLGQLHRELTAFHRLHGVSPADGWKRTLNTIVRNPLRRIPAYRRLSAARRERELANDPWYSGELSSSYRQETSAYESPDIHTDLRRSITRHSLPLYLRVEDRNSMAHSIETRLPFLDYRIVTLALTSGATWFMSGGWNKHALREAMRGVIPDAVRLRPDKMGFPVSARDWFAGPLYDIVRDVVGSPGARNSGVLRVDRILADLDRHRAGQVDCSDRLLRVLQFQLMSEFSAEPASR